MISDTLEKILKDVESYKKELTFKVDHSEKADEFLQEIFKIYKKYGMAIGHEDGHGAFQIELLEDDLVKWMFDAFDNTEKQND
jgi:hypothetical protein